MINSQNYCQEINANIKLIPYIKNKLKISINLDNFNELVCIWKTYWKQDKK